MNRDITLNVDKFKEILKKATLNYSIDCIQLNFEESMVKIGMISDENDIVTIINTENDFVGFSQHDTITFNFNQPSAFLLPHLEIVDGDAAINIIEDEKITIKCGEQKSNVHFCDESRLRRNVLTKAQKDMFDYFTAIAIDESFFKVFDKIKKIGIRYGKVYINVEGNVLSIETADKRNEYSDSLKCSLGMVESKDLTICFDFKNFINLMNVIEYEYNKEEGKRFNLNIAYLPLSDGGMVHAVATDNTEQYFLFNRKI